MNKKKKVYGLVLAVLLSVSMILSACGSAPEKTTTSGSEVAVGIPDSVKSLDPMGQNTTVYGGNVIGQIYDTLVANNYDTNEITPCLAKDWDISPDGLVYTFHLRDDVYFHEGEYQDGRKMVADDVVYTLNRALELFARNRSQLDNITSVEATDDFTVVMTLAEPDSQTLGVLTQENFGIVPKEEVEGQGDDFAITPIGTGPFKLEELSTDSYAKLVKNDKYWGTVPSVDIVTFQFISDANTMVNALREGSIDIAASLSAEAISLVEENEDLTVVNTPMRQHVALLHMNMVEGPTADIRVREAIIKAIDIDAMVAGIYQNAEGARTYLPVPKATWGYNKDLEKLVPAYDPEGAKELLTEAGYPDGFELNLYMSSTAARDRMATILQQQLKDNLNITVNIHGSDWAAFSEVVTAGKADIYGASFAFSESGDPYFYLNGFFNSSSIGSSPNGGGFSNAEIDALLAESTRVADQAGRAEIYNEIMTIALSEYPGIYYANENLIYAFNNRIEGFSINPSTIFRMEDVSIAK